MGDGLPPSHVLVPEPEVHFPGLGDRELSCLLAIHFLLASQGGLSPRLQDVAAELGESETCVRLLVMMLKRKGWAEFDPACPGSVRMLRGIPVFTEERDFEWLVEPSAITPGFRLFITRRGERGIAGFDVPSRERAYALVHLLTQMPEVSEKILFLERFAEIEAKSYQWQVRRAATLLRDVRRALRFQRAGQAHLAHRVLSGADYRERKRKSIHGP